MIDIAIFGAGGFGREVACLINTINECIELKDQQWKLIGFFDDGKEKGFPTEYGKVLGGVAELNAWQTPLDVVIAIGSPHAIKAVSEKIINPNIHFPNIIHPNFRMADAETLTIGHGNIIQGGCFASCNVSIGDFNVFNGAISMGHDDNIGNYNVFMPAIRVSGEVKIGDCNFFGVGSIILQQLKIGNRIRLGAGSVLMTKPKDGNLYLGVPAKIFKA
ncbi:MAG: serine acetyltransferase [Prevotellaceae bacterium]|nr:serine acetyltransferase [Prevotellaceae bacterium]